MDRYEVVSTIGRGGMASVFAVRRTGEGGFERALALKMMSPHLADDPHFVKMFLDEARIVSRVQHRNVVQVFDVGEHEGLPFLVMERLVGRSVSDLASLKTLPNAVLLDILAQAADGLHAAHESLDSDGTPLGLIHRDVSPHNIFVCESGDVKVVDFGIAAARGRQAGTRTGELKGKLAYVAPEQITRAHPISRCVDLWSLGVVAWELAAGRRLFRTEDAEAAVLWNVMEAPIEGLAEIAQELPAAAREIIHRCLQRDPSLRPQTAREVADVLHACAREIGGNVEATGTFVREQRRVEKVLDPLSEASFLVTEADEPPGPRTETWVMPQPLTGLPAERVDVKRSVWRRRSWSIGVILILSALVTWFQIQNSKPSLELEKEARGIEMKLREPSRNGTVPASSALASEPSLVAASASASTPSSLVAGSPASVSEPSVVAPASARVPPSSSHASAAGASVPQGKRPARNPSREPAGKTDSVLMRNPF